MPLPRTAHRLARAAVRRADSLLPPRRGITVLAYHRVGANTPVAVDLPVRDVAAQLDWLVEHALTLSLDEAAVRLSDLYALPGVRPQVVLTADDGTADWVELLLPLLVERQLPMTWYVATRFVEEQVPFPDGGRPVSWAGLADAVATGLVTVGSHTHAHAVMARLEGPAAAEELERSQHLVEQRLGTPCLHFAYPKALAPSAAADVEVRRRFRTAALAGNRVNVPGRSDPCRLGRTPVLRADGAAGFARKAGGGGRIEGALRQRYDRHRHRHAMT